MPKICALLVLLSILLLSGSIFAQNNSVKPTAVVYFDNLGDKYDESVRSVIMKSLIINLSRIPGSVVVPYEAMEEALKNKNIWQTKNPDPIVLQSIAQSFDSRQIIVGDYLSKKKDNKITIRVNLIDLTTGEKKLERTYEGAIGMSLFDTVDSMSKSVSGLLMGKELNYGKLAVSLTNTTNAYFLYINGRKASSIDASKPFLDEFIADEELEASIRMAPQNKEVLRTNFILKPKQVMVLEYMPVGMLAVNNVWTNADLYMDGLSYGPLNKDETINLRGVTVNSEHKLEIKAGNRVLDHKVVSVREGENRVVLFSNPSKSGNFNYNRSLPLLDLVVPGFAQYQAGDMLMGTVFISSWAISAGWTVFSFIGLGAATEKYQLAEMTEDKLKYYRIQETWRLFSYTGAVVWAGIALLSVVHAYTQPSLQAYNQQQQPYYTFDIDPSAINLSFGCHF